MKSSVLLLFSVLTLTLASASATASDKAGKVNRVQHKSEFSMPATFGPDRTGFPMPFVPFNNTRTQPAVSTGYYFVDSNSDLVPYSDSIWAPNVGMELLSDSADGKWTRIMSGPRQTSYSDTNQAKAYWKANPNGYCFFRNPYFPGDSLCMFSHKAASATDSTDDAIAGPIPIGIKGGFFFNGVRYDSIYVSTNGVIALTNRRYIYNSLGLRATGSDGDCYDRMSMDWFMRPRTAEWSPLSLNDTVPDDWGYRYAVLGNDPGDSLGGIRKRGGSLNSFNENNRAAIVAPFFGDLEASQYSVAKKKKNDFGKVYIKKFSDSSKTIIYLSNLSLVRVNRVSPGTTVDLPLGSRPGEQNHISMSAQVILDASDSSVKIIYEKFTGSVNNGGMDVPARTMARYNTSSGVYGWARHTGNYKGKLPVNVGEYKQYTHYFCYDTSVVAGYPNDGAAVQFRQWKNVLRVHDITYRVRSTDKTKSMDYIERVPSPYVNNFELLADEPRIGAVQPVAVVQNMSNDIQGAAGTNYQQQDLCFRVRCLVYNTALNRIIYNKTVNIDSSGLAMAENFDNQAAYFGNKYCRVRYSTITQTGDDYYANNMLIPNANGYTGLNGIPPYGYAEVYFPPFEPNQWSMDENKNITDVGRMAVVVEAEPVNPKTGAAYKESWPFDNSMERTLFVMNRLTSFWENFNEYYSIKQGYNSRELKLMASPYRWINIGSEVLRGEDVSLHLLPPSKTSTKDNNGLVNRNYQIPDMGEYRLTSPLVNMNRVDLDGTDFSVAGEKGGDEIRSFPVDLRDRHGSHLIIGVQRSNNNNQNIRRRGWCDDMLTGCEPRTILNGNPLQQFNFSERSAAFSSDELVIEFAKPSPDYINGITNIGTPLPYIASDLRGTWRYHPRRSGAAPITNMAAYTLYGAGGSLRGFFEKDKDSALTTVTGLRSDIYDDGIDESFRYVFIPIPDTIINSAPEGAKNFRFRVRVNALDDRKGENAIVDDNDDFYIDNIYLVFPCECTDASIISCKPVLPCSMIPASQAVKIPIKAKLTEISPQLGPSCYVSTRIYYGTKDTLYDPKPVYCKRVDIPFLYCAEQKEVTLPEWDATGAALKYGGKFHMVSSLYTEGGDISADNDTVYYDFELKIGDAIAYDDMQLVNDVEMESGNTDRGLSLSGYNHGGVGSVNTALLYQSNPYAFGDHGGDKSGRIAVKFELVAADTIKGYQAFFQDLSMSPDHIAFSIHKDNNGVPENFTISGSQVNTLRGMDDIRNDYYYNNFATTLLDSPLFLEKGTYWLAISQLGTTGLNLGAGGYRMGTRTTNVYVPVPLDQAKDVGAYGNTLMIDKEFRVDSAGNYKGNQNYFAYENYLGSGIWVSFMPTTGNPAFGHLHHFGATPSDNGYTWTLSNGTWIPYLRPYFGERNVSTVRVYEDCWWVPVELTSFSGKATENAVNLFWETASEIENFGFFVQRRDENNRGWKDITFVKGKGTSTSLSRYNYCDRDVVTGKTYEYRLNQVDLNGSKDCGNLSDIVTVTVAAERLILLEQNHPNPFTTTTTIGFTLAVESDVRLEIVDLFGNNVAVPVNDVLSAKKHEVVWNREYSNGTKAPAGTYIYRLTAGDTVLTGKMTVVE